MEPIRIIESRTVVIPRENVDTDQIIPARFLKVTDKKGLGKALFSDWRYDADGKPRADFVLNRPEAQGCTVLVAGDNFGCGSSREHAPWALVDSRLPRRDLDPHRRHLPEQRAQERARPGRARSREPREAPRRARARRSASTSPRRRSRCPTARRASFPLDGFAKYCLMNGVDELGFLLSRSEAIAAFEVEAYSGGRADPARADARRGEAAVDVRTPRIRTETRTIHEEDMAKEKITGAMAVRRALEAEGVEYALRHARRDDPADLRRAVRAREKLEARAHPPRAGGRPRGGGLRARDRQGRRVHGHVRPGRDEPRHRRSPTRTWTRCRSSRSPRTCRDVAHRHGRLPGGGHHRHHDADHEAQLPRDRRRTTSRG